MRLGSNCKRTSGAINICTGVWRKSLCMKIFPFVSVRGGYLAQGCTGRHGQNRGAVVVSRRSVAGVRRGPNGAIVVVVIRGYGVCVCVCVCVYAVVAGATGSSCGLLDIWTEANGKIAFKTKTNTVMPSQRYPALSCKYETEWCS